MNHSETQKKNIPLCSLISLMLVICLVSTSVIVPTAAASNGAVYNTSIGSGKVINTTSGKDIDTFSDEVREMLAGNDSGKPISYSFDNKAVVNNKGTYMVRADVFSDITGDAYAVKPTDNKIKLSHGNTIVSLAPNDRTMYIGDEEIYTMPSSTTKNESGYYFPIEDVAEGLGYSVAQNENGFTLTRKYQTKRLIVEDTDGLEDTKGAIDVVSGYDNLYLLQYSSEEDAEEACEYFNTVENVVFAEPDEIVTAEEMIESENNEVNALSIGSYSSWGAQAMGVDHYENYLTNVVGNSNLNDVTIAVLDTGIDTDHEWFANRIASGGRNFSSSISSTAYEYEDVNRHGTHVSGIICDQTLDNVKILPIKVMGDQGYGYTSNITLGIKYVTEQKQSGKNICAMNLSLGQTNAPLTDCQAYQTALQEAYNAGILPVVAAGNDGSDAGTFTPANIDCAITVAAVGQSGSTYYRPLWSNYGSVIDVSAPGYNIVSAKVGGGTVSMSGTSMAAPHVAAVIGLLFSDSTKTYTLSAIENVLDCFSVDLGDPGWDKYFGEGMVNVEYAYASPAAPVAFSKTTSDCTESFNLTLTCSEPGAKIYYTLDGSSPSYLNGTLYTGAIVIGSTLKVKAIAYVYNGGAVAKCSKTSGITYYFYGQDVANAYTVSADGTLTGYSGILTDITVPKSVNGITIKSIGSYAFTTSNAITVTLWPTVTTIGSNAFSGCKTLKTVDAPGVTSIGVDAFFQCSAFQNLTDDYFPELLTIHDFAFCLCFELRPITLSKVTVVDQGAFSMNDTSSSTNPTYLTRVTLPNVISVGKLGFSSCKYLTEINLPNATAIYSEAFKNCNVVNLSLPSAKFLGNNSFNANENLISVDLPEAIMIDDSCFSASCTKLVTINLPKVKILGEAAFRTFHPTSLDLPQVEKVGSAAFELCFQLKTINAPNLKEIGPNAFGACSSLEEVNLPSVISIGKSAFKTYLSHSKLKKVILSSCIESIAPDAFVNLDSSCVFYLYLGTVAEEFAVSGGYTYVDLTLSSSYFTYQVINNAEVYITGYSNDLPENAVIPSYIKGLPVTKICANAFNNCTKIASINMSKLTEIEPLAFANCTNLKEITIPNIKTIGEKAFYYCKNLSSSDISKAISIGNYAFYGCSALLSVELGENINDIGTSALGFSADELVIPTFVIYGYSDTVAESYANAYKINFTPTYTSLPMSAFYYSYYTNNGKIEINIISVNKDIAGNFIVPSTYNGYTVSKITASAFYGCSFITGIKLPKTITAIDNSTFDQCPSLERIEGENVASIGVRAFSYCKLTSVCFPNLKVVGEYAFAWNNFLQSVDIANVTVIGKGAFSYCDSLEKVNAPEVTRLDENAFLECISLKTVSFPKVEEIGASVFSKAQSLQTINIENAKTIGDYAFGNCESLETLYLPSVTQLGKFLFTHDPYTNKGLKKLVVGRNITTILGNLDPQSGYKNLVIYGYENTAIQTSAAAEGYSFVAIPDIAVMKDLDDCYSFSKNKDALLSVTTAGFELSYQWYVTTTNQAESGTKIDGATSASFHVDTSGIGTGYYYLEITDWEKNTKVYSKVAKVDVCDFIKGDINDDGKVDLADVTILSRYVAEWPNLSYVESALDVNGDGAIDLLDVTVLSRFVAGWGVI